MHPQVGTCCPIVHRGDTKSPFNHKLHLLFIILVVAHSGLSFMCMMAQLAVHLKHQNPWHPWRCFRWERGGKVELTQRGHFLLDYDGKAVKYVPAYLPFLTCDAYVPVLCTYIITKQLNTCGCVETLQVRGSNQHSGKPQFCFVYIVRIYAIKTHFTSLMTPGVHRVSAPVKFDSARHHKLDFCSPPPPSFLASSTSG